MAKNNKNRTSADKRGSAVVAEAPPPAPPTSPTASPGQPSNAPVLLRWFMSQTVRHAVAMGKHVQKLLSHQRDILSPQAIDAINGSIQELRQAVRQGADKGALAKGMEKLETVANKWLKPYPNAAWRENVEVLLVALAVAMGIRTFFLQPFKIPTGSMQPSLYGVTSVPDYSQTFDPQAPPSGPTDFSLPSSFWGRVRDWFGGVSYLDVRAEADGSFKAAEPPFKILIFNIYQTIHIGDATHDVTQTIWFPPDYGGSTLERRAGLHLRGDKTYHKGDQIVRMKVVSGDHLFVDRVTYNFRAPKRGEIIVFETRGITRLPQDQFYIKRMVAMGNEKVQVGDDRHLVIDGKRIDGSTPHFEKVYGFDPKEAPRESRYSGHVNDKVAREYNFPGELAPLFPDGTRTVEVPPDSYMVMGDNTMNSFDSRSWGPFPATNVIGKSFFVYWPITDRFGVGYHR